MNIHDPSLSLSSLVPETTPQSSVTSPSSTSLRVQWEVPIVSACFWNGQITRHLITYTPVGGASENVTIYSNSTELEHTLTNLLIYTEYTVTVSLGTVIGFSELHTSHYVQTLNDSKTIYILQWATRLFICV